MRLSLKVLKMILWLLIKDETEMSFGLWIYTIVHWYGEESQIWGLILRF